MARTFNFHRRWRLLFNSAPLILVVFLQLAEHNESFSVTSLASMARPKNNYFTSLAPCFATQTPPERVRAHNSSLNAFVSDNAGDPNSTSSPVALQEFSEILHFEDISENIQEISENIQEISQQDAGILEPKALDRDTIINVSIFVISLVVVAFQIFSVEAGLTRGWSPEEIAYRVPIDNWMSYTEVLSAAPIQTKAVTSATVYAIGDIIAQRTEGLEVGELNRGRIIRSLAAGLIGHGPLSHVWYDVSEDFFENVLKLTQWWSFIPKVVIDQILWGPFWNNTYIVLLGIMQFQKPSQLWADIKRTTIPLVISGLKLWPLAHCITYGLVPVENRLLWVDAVEIIWVTILATQASGGGGHVAPDADDDSANHAAHRS
mmetsp:Transcript_12806/g.27240  ORF Transcript_12806/g.27240 Transcript_12806/m.27240 type:complete len:376 (-) Transcript_12806:182-1309(-)